MRHALLLLAAAAFANAASAAQPFGRLFFTPAERAQLDVARTQKQRPPQVGTAETVETPPAPPAPQIITYSGIVRRNDGSAVLWLNNRPVDAKDALSGLAVKGRVRPDGTVTMQGPQSGTNIELKVGQRAELQSGKVGEARPAPPPAKPEAVQTKPPETEGGDKKSEPAPAAQPKSEKREDAK
ncbi:MAG TPA: hypothetical protein VM164_04685 [Burkholderiales bacterium]|nr:hypothetical protein [Burkholderiales bacterium]